MADEINTTEAGAQASGGATNAQTQQTQQTQTPAPKEITIDYDKLASVVEGKRRVAGETAMKSFLREQGLSGDELKSAIAEYKAKAKAKEPDVDAMQKEINTLRAQALHDKVDRSVMEAGLELGLSQKVISRISGLVVTSPEDVIGDDGTVNTDKVKEAFGELLNDIPELKPGNAGASAKGFQIGGNGNSGEAEAKEAENERLKKLFGVK